MLAWEVLDYPEEKRNSCLGERIACGGKGILADFQVAKVFSDLELMYTFEGTYDRNTLVTGREVSGFVKDRLIKGDSLQKVWSIFVFRARHCKKLTLSHPTDCVNHGNLVLWCFRDNLFCSLVPVKAAHPFPSLGAD
ncbi:uncharacterized protein LOC108328939 isoform X2 [Vigna angularis]|uniref:uncharacterized protein LOC108328939 isoform X2 n=1 Tax=Phaseolus angularis TaxID=3914 RepID=UPI0022B4A31B|nr:uncharacterized protein LOC108328939 isoform X2 [Vigna angularis]